MFGRKNVSDLRVILSKEAREKKRKLSMMQELNRIKAGHPMPTYGQSVLKGASIVFSGVGRGLGHIGAASASYAKARAEYQVRMSKPKVKGKHSKKTETKSTGDVMDNMFDKMI